MIETFHITIADLERIVRQRVQFEAARDSFNSARRDALATATASVRHALDVDLLQGRPSRGRAGRIARRLNMNRRTVHRILATLLSVA